MGYLFNFELSFQQFEKEALVNSGWWSNIIADNTSDHCEWPGVTCNRARSITEIFLFDQKIERELSQFNCSCFPNLETLNLGINSLYGIIPSQIGALTKLKCHYLYTNNLTAELHTRQ